MSKEFNSISVLKLLDEVSDANLYPKLLIQVQKDFNRAGIPYNIDPDIAPKNLIATINNVLIDKLQNAFNEYLNLLYAVDVSEKEVRNFESEKVDDIAVYVTYLILKREWQKVWLKNKFNQ